MGFLVRELTGLELKQVKCSTTSPLQRRRVGSVAGWSLEEAGGRAALLAGAVERHAGAGKGLCLDGRMAYDLCKDQRCEVNREITTPDWCHDHRKRRALLRYDGYIHSG
jgi:hypothetical protein